MNLLLKKNFHILYYFPLLFFLFSCSDNFKNKPEEEKILYKADSLYRIGKAYSEDSLNQKKALRVL